MCDDAPSSDTPTMGWILDDDGERIPDSQGFCLNKSEEVLTGNVWCGGEVMFDGYEILAGLPGLQVSVSLFTSIRRDILTVDSEVQQRTHNGANVFAVTLENDFSSYGLSTPLFDNQVFYVPTEPTGHSLVDNAIEHVLVVPAEEVTQDGSEADIAAEQEPTYLVNRMAACGGSLLMDLQEGFRIRYDEGSIEDSLLIVDIAY